MTQETYTSQAQVPEPIISASQPAPQVEPGRARQTRQVQQQIIVPRTTGSKRARALRNALKSQGGFFTAVQTAELLQEPVSLRRITR